jgi:hypothetical protein
LNCGLASAGGVLLVPFADAAGGAAVPVAGALFGEPQAAAQTTTSDATIRFTSISSSTRFYRSNAESILRRRLIHPHFLIGKDGEVTRILHIAQRDSVRRSVGVELSLETRGRLRQIAELVERAIRPTLSRYHGRPSVLGAVDRLDDSSGVFAPCFLIWRL